MSSLALPGANALLNGTAIPATLYVQLHIGNPGSSGTSNVATETTRQSFTRTTSTLGTCENTALLQWLSYPAAETISHVSVWSASSGGTCWFIGDPANLVAGIGDIVQLAAGDLDLTCPVWS